MAPPIYMRPKGACVTDESNLRVQHSPMLSSGYAREQKEEEPEEKKINRYSKNSNPSSPLNFRNLTEPRFFVSMSAGLLSPFMKNTRA